MGQFAGAVAKGAAVLGVAADALLGELAGAGITEEVWDHVKEEDFVAGLTKLSTTKALPVFKLRKAFAVIGQTVLGAPAGLPPGTKPEAATVDQLISAVDLDDPESDVMGALLKHRTGLKGKKGQKLGDVAFIVLDADGKFDGAATRAVVDLMRRGMPPAADEIVDPQTGKPYVVYRHDELPTTQVLIDPVFPDKDLRLRLSMRFKVPIRLTEEKHRLLLLLRRKGKVAAPADKPECEQLLQRFAEMSVEQLLDKYGALGLYTKAKRLPMGAPAGLPNIVRNHEEAGATLGEADEAEGSEEEAEEVEEAEDEADDGEEEEEEDGEEEDEDSAE